jgi:hypothetical protein
MRLYEFSNGGAGYKLLRRLAAGTDYADRQAERIRQIKRDIESDETARYNATTNELKDWELDKKLERLHKERLARNIWAQHRIRATAEQIDRIYRKRKKKQTERLLKHKIRR